jgi:hypothetical protein
VPGIPSEISDIERDNESVDAGSTMASNSIGEIERGRFPEKTVKQTPEVASSVISDKKTVPLRSFDLINRYMRFIGLRSF